MKNILLNKLFLNEVFYFVLITLLVYFNSDSRWTKSSETAYLCLIITNSLAVISIMIVSISIKIFQKCAAKCKANKISPKTTNIEDINAPNSRVHEFENAEFTPSFSLARPSSKIDSVGHTSEVQMDAVRYYYSKQKKTLDTSKTPISYIESDAERYWKNYSNV